MQQNKEKLSTPHLTEEQKHFYQLLRIRATSEKFGQPYISYAIFKLIPVNAPDLKTMGVDPHYRVYIDFDYMMEKGIEYAAAVLNHEPWHLLRNHEERRKTVNAEGFDWNVVGDLEINDDLKNKVPKDSIFPEQFNLPDNETAEYYYEQLKKRAKENKTNKIITLTNADGNPIENPNCSDVPKDYILDEKEAPAVDPVEAELIAREVAQEIKNYNERNPGKLSKGTKFWAEAKLKPSETKWQKILRAALRSSLNTRGQTDFVKSRPNRKQPVKGILLPAMRSPKPNIVVGIDTSGSHIPMLPTVLSEIWNIIKKVGVRGDQLKAFTIDTEMLNKPKIVNHPNQIDLTGGGGTDMMPAFNWVAKNKNTVDVFILMTDGEIPEYPTTPPTNKTKFVICILYSETDPTGVYSYERAVAEAGHWAKIVKIVVPEKDIK